MINAFANERQPARPCRSIEDNSSLPPLRRKIRRSFFVLVGLYAALGIFMVTSVFLAGGMSPKLIHVNYDSIAATGRMLEAWNAISQKPNEKWNNQFEAALQFAENNITEPGEDRLLQNIRSLWNGATQKKSSFESAQTAKMKKLLSELVTTNEKGMFRIAEESTSFSRKVFLISLIFFLATLGLAILFADGLAVKLARPIKQIAESLRGNPDFESRLELPVPNSIEMSILVEELAALWDRLGRFQQTNIEQIAFQHEQLRAILASVEDALLVLDHRGRILHVSDGMARILELSKGLLIGRSWTDIPNSSQNYLKLRDLLTPQIQQDVPLELTVSTEKKVFAIRSREIVSGERERVGFLYLLHDITEEHRKESLRNEFIGVLSHELKTPLQSLGTASELLMNRKEHLSEEASMLVETIAEDVSRIRAVADDFVQVGVTDLRSLKLKMEKMPLNQLMADWIRPFKVLARDKKVELEFISEGSETIWAHVDVVKLPWAISNLLANAIRVSEPERKVSVFLTDRAEMAHIEIRDEGPGIPYDVQTRMFEPYYQAPTSGGTTPGFLGLGLTIAKEVVEAHGGQVEYFPRRPTGSTFRVSLPYVIEYS